METIARDVAAGLAVIAALAHSGIGERTIFRRVRIEPAGLTLLFRLIWHCLSIGWLCGAAILVTSRATAGALVILFGSAALCNFIGTQGRHFGWAVLGAAALLAFFGW